MLTKSKSATWFKMALAVVLLLPCLLLFTACGGDPIEQDEALSALTEAGTIANYENVKSFSYTLNNEAMEIDKEEGTNTTLKTSGTSIVYKTDTETIIQINQSASRDIRIDTGMVGSSVTSASGEYKIVKIGDAYYNINESKKIYEATEESMFTQSASILSPLSYALTTLITADDITAAGDNIEMELLKTGEGAYSLKFVITEVAKITEGTDEVEQKTVTTYYYEIADKKFTKYEINREVFENNTRVSYDKYSCSFNYSETKLTAPTSIEGYKEGSFSMQMGGM